MSGAEIVSYGVDWVTATAPHDGRDLQLLAIAGSLCETAQSTGDELTVWRMQGYDGRSAKGIRYGQRKDGAIVQLSGEVAHEHWQSIVRHANNVTRLDLEVTCRPSTPDARLGDRTYKAIESWRVGREHAPGVKAVVSAGRIETVYVGARSSAAFGRLYDKEAEGGAADWGGCWRYEVEVKDKLAGSLARVLAHHVDSGRALLVYVFNWFAERGSRPVFAPPAGDLRVVRPRAESTDDRRITWLVEQVAPVLAGLIARGRKTDVLAALGLGSLPMRRGFQLPTGDR